MPQRTPERKVSARTRCDKPVQGDGVMSYHCSLEIDHEQDTLDKDDPQPCYSVDSSRSARMWDLWKGREEKRQAEVAPPPPAVQVIRCPACGEKALKIDFNTNKGGTCSACGVEVPFQSESAPASPVSLEEVEQPGKPWKVLEAEADDAAAERRRLGLTSTATTVDPEIMEAAQQRLLDRQTEVVDAGLAALGAQPSTPEEIQEQFEVNHQDVESSRAHHDFQQSMKPNCKVCVSPHRAQIEEGLIEGRSYNRIITMLEANDLSTDDLRGHFLGQHMPPEQRVEEVIAGDDPTLMRVDFGVSPTGWKPEPTKQREGDQQLPAGGDRVVQDWIWQQAQAAYVANQIDDDMLHQIHTTMNESKRVGTERYGQPLKTFDGRLNIKDLAEELRDAYVYVSKLQMTAEADRATLVRVVTEAMKGQGIAGDYVKSGEEIVAEIAVDTILDWVLTQKIGPEQVLP